MLVENADDLREQHSCIAIDLVSDLDDMCTQFILDKHAVSDLSDLEWGKGWQLQTTEFQTGLKPLFQILPMVFITHSEERELMYNGEKIKTQAPTMKKRAFNFINGKVDLIGWIIPASSTKDKPSITFRPSTMAIAGSRFDFMNTEFELDYTDMQGSYQKITDHFKNGGKNEHTRLDTGRSERTGEANIQEK